MPFFYHVWAVSVFSQTLIINTNSYSHTVTLASELTIVVRLRFNVHACTKRQYGDNHPKREGAVLNASL